MERSRGQLPRRFEEILLACGGKNNPDGNIGSKLPDARQTTIVEGRHDGTIQVIVVAQDEQHFELDTRQRLRVILDLETQIDLAGENFQRFFECQNTLASA